MFRITKFELHVLFAISYRDPDMFPEFGGVEVNVRGLLAERDTVNFSLPKVIESLRNRERIPCLDCPKRILHESLGCVFGVPLGLAQSYFGQSLSGGRLKVTSFVPAVCFQSLSVAS